MATRKKAAQGTSRTAPKNRRVQMRTPLQMRSPVVVHRKRRRSRRAKVAGLGGALVALLGAVAALTASLIMVVVTVLTALATVIVAVASTAEQNPATGRGGAGARPSVPKALAVSVVSGRCGAPTKDGGSCQRSVLAKPCPVHGQTGRGPVRRP